MTEHRSRLVEAIEKRERKTYLFRTNDFLGLPGKDVHHLRMRVATKGEERVAVDKAHLYLKKTVQSEEARKDEDILQDVKTTFILHTICRDGDDPDIGGAFYGPEWMFEHMTGDHIVALMNLYGEVLKKESPAPKTLGDVEFDAAMRLLDEAVGAEEDIPQWLLAHWPREALTEALVAAAVKLGVLRREADASLEIAAQQRQRIAELEAALCAAGVDIPQTPTEPEGETL